MTYSLCYWIIMLIWLIAGYWISGPNPKVIGGNLLLFILFVLIGLQIFGKPLHA